MAVTFDSLTTGKGNSATPSFACSPGGSDRYLLVAFARVDPAQQGFQNYGFDLSGQPLARLATENAGWVTLEVYALVNPAAGAGVLTCYLDGPLDWIACACVYNGVDQVVPHGAAHNASGSGTLADILIDPSDVTSMVFAAASGDPGTYSLHGGATERVNDSQGIAPSNAPLAVADDGGGGPVDMAWTLTPSLRWCAWGVELLEVGQPAPPSGKVRAITRLNIRRSLVGTRTGD